MTTPNIESDAELYNQLFNNDEQECYNKCKQLIPTAIEYLCQQHVNVCYKKNIFTNFDYDIEYSNNANYSWVTSVFKLQTIQRKNINSQNVNFKNVNTCDFDYKINVQQIWADEAIKLENERVQTGVSIVCISKTYSNYQYINSEKHFTKSYEEFKQIKSNNHDHFRLKVMKTSNSTHVFFIIFLDYCLNNSFYFKKHDEVKSIEFNKYITHQSRWVYQPKIEDYRQTEDKQSTPEMLQEHISTHAIKQELHDLKSSIKNIKKDMDNLYQFNRKSEDRIKELEIKMEEVNDNVMPLIANVDSIKEIQNKQHERLINKTWCTIC